jgi:hypothetical protein
MTNTDHTPTVYASTLESLCDQLDAFCTQHRLPKESADELLCQLLCEEPWREELCVWLHGFIERWDAVSDAEHDAWKKAHVATVKTGYRFSLRRAVDRFPDFCADVGMTGTVTAVMTSSSVIAGKMDQPIPGARSWDNEIYWDSTEAFLQDTEPCP